MKRLVAASMIFGILIAMPVSASAASPHFKKGGTPVCTATTLTLSCTGSLAGLGNGDVTITLSAPALASFACVSPGGNESPGQNKVPFTAGSTTVIPSGEIKNGNLTFTVSAPARPPTATATQAGCPNPNWSTRLTSIEFVGTTTLTIAQGGAVLFTCSGPSPSAGGSTTLTCS
jgi:hypothetical protein